MEFQRLLDKLRFSDKIDRSLLTKEIIANVRHIQKTELTHILQLLQTTTDMEFQVKLLLILSACLLYNNTNRSVLIKCSSLYDTLYTILIRGLPMKSTVALNFVALLLYSYDVETRSRTLTLHAQSMLRSSGCLTTMTQLFYNYMLYIDTWKALCRCIAEVCRGSEINQSFCSHLVPLCIQKCVQGNLDVFPVLHSLLYNHKRNTTLFMETEGMTLFNRKDYLRYETCLQLLHTVIQNAEVETLRILSKQNRIDESLQNCIKLHKSDSRVSQWIRINIYYLEMKLKEHDNILKPNNIKQNNKGTNFTNENDFQDKNLDNTQTLFHNIMTEIISHPYKLDNQNPWLLLNKDSKVSSIRDRQINDITMHSKQRIEFNSNQSYYLPKTRTMMPSSEKLYNEQLSFSFLMKDKLRDVELNRVGKNAGNRKLDTTIIDCTMHTDHRNQFENNLCHDTTKSYDEDVIEFKPAFVSTPLRKTSKRSFLLHKKRPKKYFSNKLEDNSVLRHHTGLKTVRKKIPTLAKDSAKHKSMSSRLLEAINESCTTIIKSVKNVFTGNKNSSNRSKESINKEHDTNEDEKSICSYSFTKYMQRREAELNELNTKHTENNEISTNSDINTCTTCNDTLLLKQKLANDDQLKLTVKKLKFGINLYGCDFKKISKTMWPRETYMTPSVVYNLYRRLIVK